MKKKQIIDAFNTLCCSANRGFEAFLTEKTDAIILERIELIEENPLTYVQLNQLFSFANIPAVSDGFFQYYWASKTLRHPYDITRLEEYQSISFISGGISSLQHLKWGIHRIVIDSLLFFGNINTGFTYLHDKSIDELNVLFQKKMYNTELIANRGEPLNFSDIDKGDRYLVVFLHSSR